MLAIFDIKELHDCRAETFRIFTNMRVVTKFSLKENLCLGVSTTYKPVKLKVVKYILNRFLVSASMVLKYQLGASPHLIQDEAHSERNPTREEGDQAGNGEMRPSQSMEAHNYI